MIRNVVFRDHHKCRTVREVGTHDSVCKILCGFLKQVPNKSGIPESLIPVIVRSLHSLEQFVPCPVVESVIVAAVVTVTVSVAGLVATVVVIGSITDGPLGFSRASRAKSDSRARKFIDDLKGLRGDRSSSRTRNPLRR